MVIDVLGGLLKATANHFHITEKIIIFLFHHLQREVGKFHLEVDKNDGTGRDQLFYFHLP